MIEMSEMNERFPYVTPYGMLLVLWKKNEKNIEQTSNFN